MQNLYSYGSGNPSIETDPSGLVARIARPCGYFKWEEWEVHGRPGWKIYFNPAGCECPGGKIKLVQVIMRGGNSYFDGTAPNQDDNYSPVDPKTDYPGFCESRKDSEHCKLRKQFPRHKGDPEEPDGFRDAPQGSYAVSICAVCQIEPGKESLLGCVSFERSGDGHNVVPPGVERPCKGKMTLPSGQPQIDWWNQAEKNWKERRANL
jgi:hypothetical protein